MAMEERQTKIREGAGLEESRLNTEFIDMMRKWGGHFVTGLAVIAGLYFGYHKWELWRAESADAAFVELNEAAKAANPTGLESVSRDHAGTAVALQATAEAADLHLTAARSGVPIGARFNTPADLGQPPKDTNKLVDDKPFLTNDEKKQELAKAEGLFQSIVKAADSSDGQQLFAIGALNGLASVSEDRGDLAKAKEFYQQAAAKAGQLKLTHLQDIIKKRIDGLDALKEAPKLFAAADLPGGKDPAPTVVPMGSFTATTSTGEKIPITAGPGGPAPTPAPGAGSISTMPVPAPAPAPPPAPPASPGDPAKPGPTP